MLTEGMRQISRLELADIRRGLENFTSPSAAGLLDSFGRTRGERVEKMAALLRNSSEADIEEMGTASGWPWPSWPRSRRPGARLRPRRRAGKSSRGAGGARRQRSGDESVGG